METGRQDSESLHPDPPRPQGGRRLWQAVLVIILLNLWGVRFWMMPEEMERGFENLDTRVIADRLQQPYHPFQWFTGDWALGNGFYRPVPTLSFALDVRLWGLNYNLYKIQNWLIAVACSFLVVWFVWELLRSAYFALGSGVLFAGWQSGAIGLLPWELLGWLSLGIALIYGALQGRTLFWKWALMGSLLLVLCYEISFPMLLRDLHNASFSYRAMGWPPGRTSTFMTLFALAALASYCRFERTRYWGWACLGLTGLLGAFGCHEQAITLPFLLVLCATFLKMQGVRVRWHYLIVPFLLLGAYLYFHTHLIPADTEYRNRRMRGINPARDALISWLFPAWRDALYLISWVTDTDSDLLLFVPVMLSFWLNFMRTIAYSTVYIHIRRYWSVPAFGLLGSAVAYGPLAFVLPLQHYYYFPLVFRSVFVLALGLCVWQRMTKSNHRRDAGDLEKTGRAQEKALCSPL